MGKENIAPTEIRSPDRPARNESLYRLSYPGPHQKFIQMFKYQVPTSHKTHYSCITKTNSQFSVREESPFVVTILRHKQGHCAGKMRILIKTKADDTQFISAGRGRTSTHRSVHVRTRALRTESLFGPQKITVMLLTDLGSLRSTLSTEHPRLNGTRFPNRVTKSEAEPF
jgi:hypothetical protein